MSNPRSLFHFQPHTPTRRKDDAVTLNQKNQPSTVITKEKFIKPATPKTPMAAANYERCMQARRAMSADRSPATPNQRMKRNNPIIHRSSSENCVSDNLESSRMTVAIRIRPLLLKEANVECSNFEIHDTSNELVISDNSKTYMFKLDHCLGPETEQQAVYKVIAEPLLDAAFNGYNVCLFAYGQTGSGKSYSMMGDVSGIINSPKAVTKSVSNSGIIPRFCEHLFQRIPNNTIAQIKVCYLEIYNEFVYDLLSNERKPLKVRENPETGPFVVDLSVHNVDSLKDMQKWLLEGARTRVTASTNMNDQSSRSHSIFKIYLTLTEETNLGVTQKCSQINLVDLAGSERVAQTKATEERFKEGRNINLSLMTLGQVITNLSDNSAIPPYRNSTLTYLLKDSLGGNSRTTMLATINPLLSHVEESLATLRYAVQARNIVNNIRKNQDSKERCLRCENMRLLEELKFKEWHNTINELEVQNRKKNENICNKEFEIEQLKKRIDYQSKQLLEIEKDASTIHKNKEEHLFELMKTIQRREQELRELREERDQLARNSIEIEIQLKRQTEENNNIKEMYQTEIKEKSETVSKLLKDNLEMKVKYLEQIDERDILVNLKEKEIKKLSEENEKLSMDLVYKENKEVTDLMKELDKKDDYINKLLRENESITKLSKQLEKNIEKLNITVKENQSMEKLHYELTHKDDEIKQIKKKINELTIDGKNKDECIKTILKQNNELVEQNKNKDYEIEKYDIDLNNKEEEIIKLKEENNDIKITLQNEIKHRTSESKKIKQDEWSKEEIKRLEDLIKENECERMGLLTKDKRRDEELKRLKEDIEAYKRISDLNEDLLKKFEDYKQTEKDIIYYEKAKEKLEIELEKVSEESDKKIQLRDKELEKKHEAIGLLKVKLEEYKQKIQKLESELANEREFRIEQDEKVKKIKEILSQPIPQPTVVSSMDFLQRLDLILGLY